jgi:non-homologous end joining protein Ku
VKRLTWQDRIKGWSRADKKIYVALTDEERAEVNKFAKHTESMTMLEIMAYTKKTQPDGRHPFAKYREKYGGKERLPTDNK